MIENKKRDISQITKEILKGSAILSIGIGACALDLEFMRKGAEYLNENYNLSLYKGLLDMGHFYLSAAVFFSSAFIMGQGASKIVGYDLTKMGNK